MSFSCERGELLAIAGPSGCGKSTLLRCINGINPHVTGGAMAGDILFDGRSIRDEMPEDRWGRMGTVFQDFEAQIIHFTVEDELAFGLENMAARPAEIDRRIDEIVPVIGLARGEETGSLSGGQKQRLCVGGALACSPELLLLDEPLSNLDADSVRGLLNALVLQKERGRAVVVVEHRLDLIGKHADRVLWLEEGRLTGTAGRLPPVPVYSGGKNASGEPAIRARGLAFAYRKGTPVFSGVDLTIGQGEMAVVLGRNGSGKSTLLKMLAGLLPVQDGSLHIMGEDARRRPASFFRRQVALVTQNPNHQLFMDSVYNEIFFNCRDDRLTRDTLETFGLERLRDRHPYSLSEGEKRRTALAAAIAARPKIILLDEPTLGQDRANLLRMIEALRQYNEKAGLTVVTVTHEEAAARALGDRAVAFVRGALEPLTDDSIKKYFSRNSQ